MKRISLSSLLIFALSLTMLSACGGGSSSTMQPPAPTKAVINISTTGTLGSGTVIGGITVTGVLPAGVTVKATPDPQNPSVLVTDSGVVIASGVTGANALALNTYNSSDRKVTIHLVDPDGFPTGQFVTVNCDIASGTRPTAGDFSLTDFKPKDLGGADISGLMKGFTVDIN